MRCGRRRASRILLRKERRARSPEAFIGVPEPDRGIRHHSSRGRISGTGASIARIRVDNTKAGRDLRVEQPYLLSRQTLQQLARLLLRNDELDLDGERAGELEEVGFVQQMMAPEAGHRAKRGTAANSEPVGLLQQPLPYQDASMTLPFVYVESEEAALHDDSPRGSDLLN